MEEAGCGSTPTPTGICLFICFVVFYLFSFGAVWLIVHGCLLDGEMVNECDMRCGLGTLNIVP